MGVTITICLGGSAGSPDTEQIFRRTPPPHHAVAEIRYVNQRATFVDLVSRQFRAKPNDQLAGVSLQNELLHLLDR